MNSTAAASSVFQEPHNQGKEEEVDAFYEFHSVAEEDEQETTGDKVKEHGENRERKRSISLTDHDDDHGPQTPVPAIRNVASFGRIEDVTFRNSVGGVTVTRNRHGGSTDLNQVGHTARRPSSMLIHDNDELLKLAEELHLRDIQQRTSLFAQQHDKHETPVPKERKIATANLGRQESQNNNNNNNTSLVRRNSSGYSSGSSSYINAQNSTESSRNIRKKKMSSPVTTFAPTQTNQYRPVFRPPVASGFNAIRRGSVTAAILGGGNGRTVVNNETFTRRASMNTPQRKQSSSNNEEATKSKLTIGSLFGSSTKKSSVTNGSSVQHKISKKYDRQSSDTNQSQVDQKVNEKRKHFIQSRSSTTLNLFGGSRRKSIAVTDDAYNAAMRSAKSHLDLSQIIQGSPATSKKLGSTPGPSLSDLTEEPDKHERSSTKSFAKVKQTLKDRPWTEIERLWRGKARDPPNIDHMLKSGRTKERSARSKTVPIGEKSKDLKGQQQGLGRVSSAPFSQPQNFKHGIRSERSAYPISMSVTNSPKVTQKAIDLLAPHVISKWQREQGYSPAFQRYHSVAEDLGQDRDHFEELVRTW